MWLSQTNIEGQTGIKYPVFNVLIVNIKEAGEIEYNIQYLFVVYHQRA